MGEAWKKQCLPRRVNIILNRPIIWMNLRLYPVRHCLFQNSGLTYFQSSCKMTLVHFDTVSVLILLWYSNFQCRVDRAAYHKIGHLLALCCMWFITYAVRTPVCIATSARMSK